MVALYSYPNMQIEEIITQYKRYQYDTDWQEMNGPDLVDVDAETWLRSQLHQLLNELAEEVEGLKERQTFNTQAYIEAAKQATYAPFDKGTDFGYRAALKEAAQIIRSATTK